MTTENTVIAPETVAATVISPDLKVEADNLEAETEVQVSDSLPIGKAKNIHITKLKPNKDNDRFSPGHTIGGFVMPDTLDLNELTDWIKSEKKGVKRAGQLTDPMYVLATYKFEDGKKVVDYYKVIRGNRRYYAMMKMWLDPKCEADIKEELKSIKCVVFDALTAVQEAELVNDKNAKGLTKPETIALLWRDADNGMSRPEIYSRRYRQMGPVMANADGKIAEFSAIEDFKTRRAKIAAWMGGTVGTKYLLAGELGNRVRKACMLELLMEAHQLPKDGPKPEFKVTQHRNRELNNIKESELAVWTPENGSPAFNAKLDEFHLADLPELDPETAKALGVTGGADDTETDSEGNPIKRRTAKEMVEMVREKMKSITVQTAVRWARGETVNIVDLDAAAKFWETVTNSLVKNADNLPGELGAFARTITGRIDADAVCAWLDRFSAPVQPPADDVVDGEIVPRTEPAAIENSEVKETANA